MSGTAGRRVRRDRHSRRSTTRSAIASRDASRARNRRASSTSASEIADEIAAAPTAQRGRTAEAVPGRRIGCSAIRRTARPDALALRMLEHELGPAPRRARRSAPRRPRSSWCSSSATAATRPSASPTCRPRRRRAPATWRSASAPRGRTSHPGRPLGDPTRSRTRRPRRAPAPRRADHAGTTVRETATELRELAAIAAPPERRDVATAQARA